MTLRYVRFFRDIRSEDIALVGGKNAALGEMYRELGSQGIPVPNGFAVTAEAYQRALDDAGAWKELHLALDGLDPTSVRDLEKRGRRAREIVLRSPLPREVSEEIVAGCRELEREYGEELTVAVRSSATAEDLPEASFAGQQETYLNVKGDAAVLDAVRRCYASLFTDRAIHYRIDKEFDHFRVRPSVGIMKMVRSDLASAGVMFTLDTESGFRDVVLITGAYGLGENVVQGAVAPDEFYVHKPTFLAGYPSVLRRLLGSKKMKMVYATGGSRETTRNLPTPKEEQRKFCLRDEDVLALADYGMRVEAHFSRKAGRRVAMDIEWAKDGLDGRLYLVQARPETVASRRPPFIIEEHQLAGSAPVLLTGRAVGTKIGSGVARVISSAAGLGEFQPGEVLVSDTTTPDWEPVMKQAAAIVTSRGGRTCHAAIVARELGIPAVVGASGATERLASGPVVTVSCAEGDRGRVYLGAVPFQVRREDVSRLERPRTHVMVNVGNPDLAFKTSFTPNDGVGLARIEFIIAERVKAHPLALLHPEKLPENDRRALSELTRAYERPSDYFVETLSEGVGTIAAAFYPKPVIVRLSDFKTNEYANLLGGSPFEPKEENPMIGFRGASRYAHPAYAEGFALECAAMRRVRDQMGFTNVKLMIPFCRSVEEGERVLRAMADQGLERGKNGLEIYVMCEIPNNVIRIDEFARIFDGFSIGSNDLTQLTLGVDRDSDLVSFDFDERDPGVLEMLRLAVQGAKRSNRPIGICGQAPSDYPDIAEFLVKAGIDSISLNADTVVAMTRRIVQLEKQLSSGGLPGTERQALAPAHPHRSRAATDPAGVGSSSPVRSSTDLSSDERARGRAGRS